MRSAYWIRILDRLVLFVGIVGPLTALPQILKIYILNDATGVSVLSWLIPALLDLPWILYGVVHRDRQITVAYSLWLLVNVLVVFGAVTHGAGTF
ncbi:MAG: hypothetical protein HYS26_04120 [Candidatus Kaiserbacteria bacterium]|nr:MAG: hypothetical protein HYS26_04120 [Candidatus Kaiserbacteria bacterium]